MSPLAAERLALTLLHSCWQGAALAALAALACAGLRRSPAQLRYGVLCAALLALPMLASATWVLLGEQVAAHAAAAAPVAAATTQSLAAASTASVAIAAPAPFLPRPAPAASGPPWQSACSLAWALGVAALAARHLWTWWRLGALAQRDVLPLPPMLAALAADCRRRLGLGARCAVRLSRRVAVPMAFGSLRPVVLLPIACVARLPPAQIEALLLHELAHVRRHDYLVNLLQTVVETLFFFHPAAWWLGRAIRAEREHCCDDVALGAGARGRALAQALGALAGVGPALTAQAGGGPVAARVRRLLGLRPAQRPAIGVPAAALCAALAVGVAACGGRAVEPLAVDLAPARAPAEQPAVALPRAIPDRQIALTLHVVRGSGPELARLGLPLQGDGMVLGAAATERVLRAASGGDGASDAPVVVRSHRVTALNGQRAAVSSVRQQAFVADFAVRPGGAYDPSIEVLNVGQVYDVRARAIERGVLIEGLEAIDSAIAGIASCSAEFATGSGLQRLPFEEPSVLLATARPAPGTPRVLAEGQALALPFAFGIERHTAQVRALARAGTVREEVAGGDAVRLPQVLLLSAQVVDLPMPGLLLEGGGGRDRLEIRARLARPAPDAPAAATIAEAAAWLRRLTGIAIGVHAGLVADGSDGLRVDLRSGRADAYKALEILAWRAGLQVAVRGAGLELRALPEPAAVAPALGIQPQSARVDHLDLSIDAARAPAAGALLRGDELPERRAAGERWRVIAAERAAEAGQVLLRLRRVQVGVEVAALCAEAERLLVAGDRARASACATDALTLDPDSARARALVERCRGMPAAREAQPGPAPQPSAMQQREQAERLLRAGELAAAEQAAWSAIQIDGGDDAARVLYARIRRERYRAPAPQAADEPQAQEESAVTRLYDITNIAGDGIDALRLLQDIRLRVPEILTELRGIQTLVVHARSGDHARVESVLREQRPAGWRFSAPTGRSETSAEDAPEDDDVEMLLFESGLRYSRARNAEGVERERLLAEAVALGRRAQRAYARLLRSNPDDAAMVQADYLRHRSAW